VTYPKIELHVHLEGTVRPRRLLETAARNGYALPADTAEGLEALYDFRDFAHFVEIFELTAGALQTYDDFRSIVVDYAAEAASHGAVYIEAIFAPGLAAGVHCSISSDDPAMFGTDLTRDCEAAVSLGLDPEQIFASGLQGALCGQATKDRLRAIGETFDWGSVRTLEGQIR
jgi:adenosine deaminase